MTASERPDGERLTGQIMRTRNIFIFVLLLLTATAYLGLKQEHQYLECKGILVSEDKSSGLESKKPYILMLEMEKYGFLVRMRMGFDGEVLVRPGLLTDIYYMRKLDYRLLLFETGKQKDELAGEYLLPEDKLILDTSYGRYVGSCQRQSPALTDYL